MFTNAFIAVLLASGAVAVPGQNDLRAACNADNCLRAVRATASGAKPGASQASWDCVSYFQPTTTLCEGPRVTVTTTITPGPPSKVTSTNTSPTSTFSITPTFTDFAGKRAQSSSPSSSPIPRSCAAPNHASVLPPYIASACGAEARFSSACACAGITSYPTITVTPLGTPTVTVTVTATPTCSKFVLSGHSDDLGFSWINFDKSFARWGSDDFADATVFTLLPNRTVALAKDNTLVWQNSQIGDGARITLEKGATLPPYSTEGSEDGDFGPHAIFCDVPWVADQTRDPAPICQGWNGYQYYERLVFQYCPDFFSSHREVVVDAIVDEFSDSSCKEVEVKGIPIPC